MTKDEVEKIFVANFDLKIVKSVSQNQPACQKSPI